MEINMIHKKMTDEQQYQNLKKYNREQPGLFMDADEWKRLRLIQLSKEGKIWSKALKSNGE